MPPILSVRPTEINLDYYPGNPIALTMNFPAGYLATRVFRTFLNGRVAPGIQGTCTEATDVLTVSFTAAQTDDFDGPAYWELSLFDTPSTYTVYFSGTWTPGTDPTPNPTTATFNVSLPDDVTVTVTAVSVSSGLPTGGTDGQVLTKTSATDFAVAWETPALELAIGSDTIRDYSGAGVAGVAGLVTLTEAFLDTETGTIAGCAWSNANDRWDITTAGLFTIQLYVDLRSDLLTAGDCDVRLAIRRDATDTFTFRSGSVGYNSGVNSLPSLNVTTYIAASGFIQASVFTTDSLTLDYAAVQILKISQ